MVASKVSRLLKEKRVNAQVDAVDIKSIETHIKQCDVYIAITAPPKQYNVPVLNGIVFLTGVGMDKELDKLLEILNKK